MQKRKKHRRKIGLPPGSIVFTGEKKVEKAMLHFLKYNQDNFTEKVYDCLEDCQFQPASDDFVDWYDLRGLHHIELVQHIGKSFNFHSLVLEAIVDTHQRPKFDEYEDGILIVLSALTFNSESLEIEKEQVAIYLKKGIVFSFQETDSDLFHLIRERIHQSNGRVRRKQADYLAYVLIDVLVDEYFLMLDQMEIAIEKMEDKITARSQTGVKEQLLKLRKELLTVRRSVSPLREAISRFNKSEADFLEESTGVYIRDLYDHIVQVMDMVENFRDILNGLQDLYLSDISLRMNQVMQVLAIITTIFVPLSFLAGLYGMNFEYIPELHYKHGYYVLLAVMFTIAVSLLFYFRKKKWF